MKFKSLIIAAAMLGAATFGGFITDGVLADEPEVIEQEVVEQEVIEETAAPDEPEATEPEVEQVEPEPTPENIIERDTGLVVDSVKQFDSYGDWSAFEVFADGDIYCITIDGGHVDVCQILN